MKKNIHTEQVKITKKMYSQAVLTDHLLFVSGQIPIDLSNGTTIIGVDFEVQAERALKNLQTVIEEAGLTLRHVVKCTCFLTNMKNLDIFNHVYERFFGEILPARECVAVKSLPRDVLVEVSAICVTKL